ncbi:hypothetical protein H7F51_07105 [Novosphingobium flavum]|uniref:Uncharacterized protein n=1 Tax=Novosphingobium flavum TaxID=1778672 RepID=A0A7X1FRP2_9SPHN|nr:hypothetical protein [Novosphingobium flavum]MBC2665282.1 hypothetical protein [Novosphingobium flavum]
MARPESRAMPKSRAMIAVAALSFAAAGIAPAAAADDPAAAAGAEPVAALIARAPRATIERGGVRIELALPDPGLGFYRGTRFDWSGMILSLRLGQRAFHGPWFDAVAPGVRDYVDDGQRIVTGPQTNGTGPAEEFVGAAPVFTPGYGEAEPGGTFIKIGVGRLLRADDRPYNRFNSYAVVDNGAWQVTRGAGKITFVHYLPLAADGYAYRYEKTVAILPGGEVLVDHRLSNTGRKPIVSQVYSHNFMRFGDYRVDPATTVTSPLLRGQTPKDPALAKVEGESLTFHRALGRGESVSFPTPGSAPINTAPVFTVRQSGGGSISGYSDSPIARALFWSIRTVTAVEPYVAIDVAPGAEQHWAWRYRYSAR